MHLPMEILSPATTRADSGTGTANLATSTQTARANPKTGNKNFEKAFEEELTRHDKKLQGNKKSPEKNANKPHAVKKTAHDKVKNVKDKKDGIDETGAAPAAGVQSPAERALGTEEQQIVSILEGEESVNPATRDMSPQMRTEDTALPPETEQEPVTQQTQDFTEVMQKSTDGARDTQQAQNSENAALKEALAAKTDAASQDTAAGDVTARTPRVTPEDTADGNSGNLADKGNPGLLENVNEDARTEEQDNEKSYANAIKEAENKSDEKPAETTAETPANISPPLSGDIKTEQFSGVQQLSKAALEQPVKPENLFEEMISRVETAQSAAKSTMTIQLNPEFLGKVALEVSIDAAGLHVKINAEDSSIRGMINAQLSTLIESLENKGIAVSEVEVVYAGANFDNPGQQESNQREGEAGGHTAKQSSNAKDSVEYYTTLTDLMDYYLETGVSSVEYSA